MLVVAVKTDAFSGEFLHKSELPEGVLAEIRDGASGLYGEPIGILMLALLDPAKREEFEALRISQALKVWNTYRLARAVERDVPNVVPEGL